MTEIIKPVPSEIQKRIETVPSEIQKRIETVTNSREIQRGLNLVSQICMNAENVLYNEKIPNLWLPLIDSSISEYSKNNFIVTSPLNNKKYSLIQSPQCTKEIAALTFGSNWRIVTCFRPEPGDATHAQMFQQIDVELRNKNGKEARKLAEQIFIKIYTDVIGENISNIPELDYKTIKELYGIDNPNLYKGPVLDLLDKQPVLRVYCLQYDCTNIYQVIGKYLPNAIILPEINDNNNFKLHGELKRSEIIVITELPLLRELRIKLINKIINTGSHTLYPYWLVNMPFANFKESGKIKPAHHIMSMPIEAINDFYFSFSNYNEKELVNLECDSYDLILCNNNAAIEIGGGDVRIPTLSLQKQVIDLFGYDEKIYKPLLDALEINEKRNTPYTLAGFAFGVERLAMSLGSIDTIDKVQIFPTNSHSGDFVHATGYINDK